eukprot:1958231-Alexandrium_andersonii.AAC.1
MPRSILPCRLGSGGLHAHPLVSTLTFTRSCSTCCWRIWGWVEVQSGGRTDCRAGPWLRESPPKGPGGRPASCTS